MLNGIHGNFVRFVACLPVEGTLYLVRIREGVPTFMQLSLDNTGLSAELVLKNYSWERYLKRLPQPV